MFTTKKLCGKFVLFAVSMVVAGTTAAARPALAAGGLVVEQAGTAVALETLQAGAIAVLDPRLSSSRELLDALHRSGYQGDGLVVLVAGDVRQAEALRRRSNALPRARWVSAEANAVLRQLELTGTPVVLGLDRQQRIAWRESGLPAVPLDLALRIAEWTTVAAMPEVH